VWAKVDFSEPAVSKENALNVLFRLTQQLEPGTFNRFRSEYLSFCEASEVYRLMRPGVDEETRKTEQERVIAAAIDAFWEDVRDLLRAVGRCCVFFDSFEVIEKSQLEAVLRDQWVSRCPPHLAKVITLVISGWNPLSWQDELTSRVLPLELVPFSGHEVEMRLSRSLSETSKPTLKRLAKAVSERTGGWPLHVGIAATILAQERKSSLAEADVGQLFEVRGPVDQRLRLELLTDHLLQRLSSRRREIIRLLSVPRWFAVGQLAAAASLRDEAGEALSDILNGLASVMRPREPEGFQMDEPLREYILESWERENPDVVRQCHLRLSKYYAQSAKTLCGTKALEFLLEAFYHDVECYRLGACERASLIEKFIGLFFEGERSGLVQISEATLAELEKCSGDPLLRPWIDVFGSRLLYWEGSWDEAVKRLSDLMEGRAIGTELRVFANQFMATLAYYRGNLALARQCVAEVRRRRLVTRPLDRARFMTEVGGDILRAEGAIEEAIKEYTEAASVLANGGDLSNAAWALLNLGNMYRLTGKWSASVELCEQALALVERTENMRLRGRILYTLGRTLMYQGKWEQALKCHTEGISVLTDARASPLEIAAAQRNEADVLRLVGEWERSKMTYLSALGAALGLGARFEQGYVLGNLGDLFQTIGDLSGAEEFYILAINAKREAGDQYGEAVTELGLGELYLCRAQYTHACGVLDAALPTLKARRHRYMQARALAAMFVVKGALPGSSPTTWAGQLASILRDARRDGDPYADVVSDLCLFLAITGVRSPASFGDLGGRVIGQLSRALCWAAEFNSRLPASQLLRFCDTLSIRGGHVSQVARCLALLRKAVAEDPRGLSYRAALVSMIDRFVDQMRLSQGEMSLPTRRAILDMSD
jgi:tetratricopeptide (TPR) repeat protein